MAAVRVIAFFPSTVEEVSDLVQEEFEVVERVDHTANAEREERLDWVVSAQAGLRRKRV